MRRYFYLLMVMGLAFSMALPLNSMGANNLDIITKDGYDLGINLPYKSFSVDGNGNLTVMLDGNKADIGPIQSEWSTINISGSGVDNSTAIVNGTKGQPVTFNIVATDNSGQTPSLSCFYPPNCPLTINPDPIKINEGVFTNTYANAGTYYADFQATLGTDNTQRQVKIIIADPSAPQQYTLSVNISPSGGGSVSLDPSPSGGTYAAGTVVTLTYSANSGYTFNSWTGVDSTYLNTATVTMNGNRTVTANFTQSTPPPGTYTLTVNLSPSNGGSVSLNPSGGSYSAGTVVTLTASANSGYTFSSWSEGLSPLGTSNPIQITMSSARTITANFNLIGGGTYSQQVAMAEKLDKITQGCSTCYGYYSGPGQGSGQLWIPLNSTLYFIVDPKTVVGTVTSVKIQFTDFQQHDNLSISIYIIDRSDNLVSVWGNPYGIPLSSNTHGPWMPRMGHKDEYRYLIKVVENGREGINYNIYWWAY